MRRVVLALAAGLVSLCVFPGLAGAAAPGAPDRSFSGNGHVITKMGGFVNNAQWGGIDSKARIVAVGGSFYRRHGVDSSDMALVRYTRHGRLDDAFSGNGKLHFRLQPRSVFARAGAIDGHGRILAAGGLCMNPTFEKDCQFVVARFKPDGRIDRSFSGDGHVITAFPGNAVITSMAVRRGKIIVGGFAGDKIALARYERNGRLDSSFGTGGIVTKDVFPGDDYVASIALDHHGRIVVADEGAGFALARFTPGGRLDPSFGHGGTVTTDFHGYDLVRSVVVGKRGRIVAAGSSQAGAGGNRRYRFAVARYRRSGKLDHSFSHDGKTKTTFSGFRDEATAVMIDSHGRVVAAGYATGFDLAIARYDPDGGLDRSFGKGGKVRDGIDTIAIPNAVLTDGRGRVVTAGDIHNRFGLARYIGYRHG